MASLITSIAAEFAEAVTPGKLADLVLIDGDPTRTIGDVRKVAAVITRGYLIYPREIDTALGIQPF
ncbi:MAG: hypothetical protein ACLGHY_12430, partial [Gammaproteobacteria bacterium]